MKIDKLLICMNPDLKKGMDACLAHIIRNESLVRKGPDACHKALSFMLKDFNLSKDETEFACLHTLEVVSMQVTGKWQEYTENYLLVRMPTPSMN